MMIRGRTGKDEDSKDDIEQSIDMDIGPALLGPRDHHDWRLENDLERRFGHHA